MRFHSPSLPIAGAIESVGLAREQVKQYVVVGRKKPTVNDPEPKIFKTKLFAPNTVVAKSRFFYFMSQLKRVKRANGEILSIQEVRNNSCMFPNSSVFVCVSNPACQL